ncbi:MAG: helix-turn-helix domain-containing protein [Chloroflexota bacterium]
MASLRELRLQKGLSQQKLAEMARIGVVTVSRAELGWCRPSAATVNAISQVLQIDGKEIGSTIASNVRRLQVNRGMTDSMLLQKAGISKRALHRLRSPDGRPSSGTIMKVAKALDVSAAEIGSWDKGYMNCWRRLRLAKRLTVAELSKCTGVSRQTIYNLENGHPHPSITTVRRLGRILGKSVTASCADESRAGVANSVFRLSEAKSGGIGPKIRSTHTPRLAPGRAIPKDTWDQIKSVKLQHPELTLREIGARVGKSHETVRRVLLEQGLPTRAVKQKGYCINCGKKLPHANRKFCSRACFHEYHRITLRCDFCGRQFTRVTNRAHANKADHRHTFCSKACQGGWLGKHYGLGTRSTKKLDYARIRQLYHEGYNGKEIASLVGEKPGAVYSALYRMGLRFRQPVRPLNEDE